MPVRSPPSEQSPSPAPTATPGRPEARDHTTLVVRLGLLLLLALGVASIFGETLLGLTSDDAGPDGPPSAEPQAPAPPPSK